MTKSDYMETLFVRQGELQSIKDEKEITDNIKNYNFEKIVDICHPTHPKLFYDCFNHMEYLPIHEIPVTNLKSMNKDDNRGYIVTVGNKRDLDLIPKDEKKIVGLRITSNHTFDSAKKFLKMTDHKIYISFPEKITDEFVDFVKDLIENAPEFTVFIPLSEFLLKIDKKLVQRLVADGVFVLSETSENPKMAMFIRLLPLKQIVLAFPQETDFLQKEPNALITLEYIEEIVQYLAEIKGIETDLIIRATAFNALTYLPRIKPIEEKLKELKYDEEEEDESEQESENADDIERFSEIFEPVSNNIIEEYEREIESLKAKLHFSEYLINKVSDFQPQEIVEDDYEESEYDLPLQSAPEPKKWTNAVKSVKPTKSTAVKFNIQSDGKYQDINGRWRSSNGKFTSAPENFISQKITVKPKKNSKVTKETTPSSTRKANPDGSFYDIKGRLHSSDGKFMSLKSTNSLDSKSSVSTRVSSTSSKTVTPTRKVNPDGSFYDIKGRLHSADGKFMSENESSSAKSTKSVISKTTVSPSRTPVHADISNDKTRSSASSKETTPSSTRKANPDGSFYDIKGRLHSSDGKFMSSKSTNSVDSGTSVSTRVSSTSSKTVTPTRKVNPDGSFYDSNGRLHSANGKFMSTKSLTIGRPQATSTPKPSPAPIIQSTPSVRSTPISSPSRISLPTGWSVDTNNRVHDDRGRFAKLPSSSNTSNYDSGYSSHSLFSSGGFSGYGLGGGYSSGGGRSSGGGSGYNMDRNGRWHGPDGRFCKAPW